LHGKKNIKTEHSQCKMQIAAESKEHSHPLVLLLPQLLLPSARVLGPLMLTQWPLQCTLMPMLQI